MKFIPPFCLNKTNRLGQPNANRLWPISLVICLTLILSLLWLPTMTLAQEPTILRVDSSVTAPGDGSAWGENGALKYLQDALKVTRTYSTTQFEIWVAAGVYYPDERTSSGDTDNRDTSFSLRYNNAQLYGGFAGVETSREQRDWETNLTILSGDIDQNDTNDDGNHVAETWNDIQGDNSYQVIFLSGNYQEGLTENTVLDGFTITAGEAINHPLGEPYTNGGGVYNDGNGFYGSASSKPLLANLIVSGNHADLGGGMYNDGSEGGLAAPTLRNVIFTGNRAASNDNGGGGLYSMGWTGDSSPRLIDVTFSGNQANKHGGGMAGEGYGGSGRPILTGVTFLDNQAGEYGGGMYNLGVSPILTDTTFSDNQATYGGGMYNDGLGSAASSPSLTSVTFATNRAVGSLGSGGGMFNNGDNNSDSSPSLTNVRFVGNAADYLAGGMYNYGVGGASSPTLINVLFSGNRAGNNGGGLVNDGRNGGDSSPSLTNVTVSANYAGGWGNGMYNFARDGHGDPSMSNSILWGNRGGTDDMQIGNDQATTQVSYSLIEGGCPDFAACDANLLTADPQFVAPLAAADAPTTGGDYRPGGASPAIDAGDSASVTVSSDLAANPRLTGSAVDLGAFEAQVSLGLRKTVTPTIAVPTGGPVTYALILSNSGVLTDAAVLLTDTLPAAVDFAAWAGADHGAALSEDEITWSGSLGGGQVLTWTFTTLPAAASGQTVTNTARFSGTSQAGQAEAAFTVAAEGSSRYLYLPLVVR